MTYLLDTMVLSEMRKRQGDANVLRWLRGHPADAMFISTITLGEIERGIERQRERDPRFSAALANWLEDLLYAFADRILPVDIPVARRWGRLAALLGHADSDLLIAATALEHDLAVATRNVRHFVPTGVAIENPFE